MNIYTIFALKCFFFSYKVKIYSKVPKVKQFWCYFVISKNEPFVFLSY
jgi:hypothetical protein